MKMATVKIGLLVLLFGVIMLCDGRAQFANDEPDYDDDHHHADEHFGQEGGDSPIAAESDSFIRLRENVLSVLKNLPSDKVDQGDKKTLVDAFTDIFHAYERKRLEEFQPADDKTRRVPYGTIHRLAHKTIDDLDINPEGQQVIHRSIHWAFTNSYGSNFCYPSYAVNHTGCLEKQGITGCPKARRGLQKKDRIVIMSKHNEYRKEVGSGRTVIRNVTLPEAAAMATMAWDEELASLAQAWADQCAFANDCSKCRRTDRLKYVGQNLVRFKGLKSPKEADWHMAIDTWARKGKAALPAETDILRNYTHNDSWAPYTQMIWDFSYLLGCGFSMYKDGVTGEFHQLYVCNYGPAGNVIGTQVYQIGPACSNCPRSHRCDEFAKICTYGEEEQAPPGFVQSAAGDTSRIRIAPESAAAIVEI